MSNTVTLRFTDARGVNQRFEVRPATMRAVALDAMRWMLRKEGHTIRAREADGLYMESDRDFLSSENMTAAAWILEQLTETKS